MGWRENNELHLVRYAQWYRYLSMFFILIFTGGVIREAYWTVKYHYYYYSISLFCYALFDLGASWLLYLAFSTIINLSPQKQNKANQREKNKIHLVCYTKWCLYLSMVFFAGFAGGVILDGYWIIKYHYYQYYSVSLFCYALFDLGVSWLLLLSYFTLIDLSREAEIK